MSQHNEVMAKIDDPRFTPERVRAWLTERLENCHRLAARKRGHDRDGWLEDAAYFAAAIGAVDWSALAASEPPHTASKDDDVELIELLAQALIEDEIAIEAIRQGMKHRG